MEAARQIKALAGERLVPLIFLTSLSDADALARCLEAGGDDFLTKPYNRVIIEAKINAFNRMRLMHETLSHQRDLIHEQHRKLTEEQEVAKRVFENVAHTGCLDAGSIRYTLDYLTRFEIELPKAANAAALIATMQQAYPQAGLAIALDIGAKVNKGEMAW